MAELMTSFGAGTRGGLMGKGLFLGSQSQLNFVPAQHTDFVFSVLGEELGFMGVLCVLLLYGTLFIRSLLPLRDMHSDMSVPFVSIPLLVAPDRHGLSCSCRLGCQLGPCDAGPGFLHGVFPVGGWIPQIADETHTVDAI